MVFRCLEHQCLKATLLLPLPSHHCLATKCKHSIGFIRLLFYNINEQITNVSALLCGGTPIQCKLRTNDNKSSIYRLCYFTLVTYIEFVVLATKSNLILYFYFSTA